MAESEPKQEKTKEEQYNEMGPTERWANLWIDFQEARGAKSVRRAKERALKREQKDQEREKKWKEKQETLRKKWTIKEEARIKRFESKREFDERIKREQEKKREAARTLGAVNASQVEKAGVVREAKEKTVKGSIWTLLWGTPLVYVASKHEKMKASAKNTLLEPFRPKSIGDLFGKIGKGIVEDLKKM